MLTFENVTQTNKISEINSSIVLCTIQSMNHPVSDPHGTGQCRIYMKLPGIP